MTIESPGRPLIACAALSMALFAGPIDSAQASSEEAQGAQLLEAVQGSDRSCGDLSDGDFELMGEAWMGQMFGDSQAHEAMNQMMSSMMGSAGEEQMHEFLGRRASGCGGGSLPSGFDRMMSGAAGMMGMMGGQYGTGPGANAGPGYGGGMMGGGMMGGFDDSDRSDDDDDDHMGGWTAILGVALLALLLGGLFYALQGSRGARGEPTPQDVLRRRLASGEIDQHEYDQRRRLLEGS